ncbi:hypothetical protein A2954_01885 [Candidatus Roizmanbacteria bacterium RIFCSPLOWO2_01_FULL_37_12]|uniref:Uncharacterized protein n=1 Tax=Candidatus Roizmanbacteria bacterium RIFCSPLOWO2_01_FULL_37_12 TaxID=1802056 RepID=A0A1F7I9Q0_9BACT|nr:MAG: hypothetical protein A2768_01370 [Candidatus Roizmanbacteria bacterium RIFCSPHIGHO2_01_FULL_37_16]OGK24364.1 MAG: hypothetical protein A3D76_01730 [Candidatus Roizmanbacteria bacterium RIFCSPHIGHO2_02_FULL_37_9b]OGK40042.1 MAG: hypothetical protein A2954_01885 [Candidatus Roizmanbacteria bacterium RIFCSPLOWO2_01_FULL_37_12]
MTNGIMDSKGLLLCARYSSAPNYFGYCGPPKNSSLIDHLREDVGDIEVKHILSQFDTLYLNLKLIAFENKIKDPFTKKVVEAYWIGNNLLNKVKNKDYVSLLSEKFKLEKKIGNKKFELLKYKFLTNQTLPHHSFHVFNIFKRTGHINSNHTLATMDSCRIGWGRIDKYQISNDKLQIKSKGQIINIKTRLLTLNHNKLALGLPINKKIKIDYKGNTFLKNLKLGDWVSFHWGFVCDVLSTVQVKNLEYYTQKAIVFYNS